MNRNVPNYLTMFRVVLVPFVVFFLLTALPIPHKTHIALALFIVASLTDLLDGKIARKYHLITTFGKFADPLADKLLVDSVLIALSVQGRVPAWIVITIIAREFIISGLRLVAAEKGIVLAASWWGKCKTAVQMVTVVLLLAELPGQAVHVAEQVLIWASLALTVISMADYLYRNRHVFAEEAK